MRKRRYDLEKAEIAIGKTIRKLRHRKRWTLEETEEHGDILWRQLQRLENGQNLKLGTIIKLANLFGVHPSDLLRDI